MRLTPALVATSFLSALSVLAPACGPSIDPALKADLDGRLAQLPTSQETYPPSETFLPMAFLVGQWTQHRVHDAKDEVAGTRLLTYKLVGQDEGGYWLETVKETYAGREVAKMHVFMLGGRDPSGMEIRALRVKKGKSAPVDVDPGDILTVRKEYQHALDLLAVSFDGDVKDDARVPGGHFIGCFKAKTSAPWGPWQRASTICAHPSVPLSGVVRATSADGGAVLDLVAFGITGAAGEL